ncbi:MAG: Rne/Rng family ribonuclease [Candidatus Caldatribacteriaceae bacterium]
MRRDIVIDMSEVETRAALLEDGKVVEFFFERAVELRLAGNVYKGIVENVLPGIQSAFVNIGLDKNAFLFVGDMLLDEKRKDVKIEGLIKVGEEVIVQVTKEPMGTKGARVSTKVTLPGRYVVFMPGIDVVGVSHRISSGEERERLKKVVERLRPKGSGIIVRTVAEGKSTEEIKADIESLVRLWNRIKKKAEMTAAPALLYQEASLIYALVRDVVDENVENVWINSFFGYQKLRDFVESILPHLAERVRFFESRENIFEHFGLQREIERALSRKVWLRSGGYLVFDRTEAMTVIDVNTGKFVGKKDLQETILKTNLEAAEEIARQVRLRDIGGIILIDFIDMEKKEHRRQVVRTLEEFLSRDRTRCTVVEMSELGLVEMTRKRVRKSLDSFLRESCPFCEGEGRVLSLETIAVNFLRRVEEISRHTASSVLGFAVGTELGKYLSAEGGRFLHNLERLYGKEILWKVDEALPPRRYSIVGVGGEEVREKMREIPS